MRVFYIECTGEHWIRIARSLRDSAGWEPIYWTGSGEQQANVKCCFPATVYHVGVDAARGISPDDIGHLDLRPISQQLIAALSETESIALQMMDRMDPDGGSFAYHERRWLYLKLVQYWTAVLDRFEPDLVCFSLCPHVVFDYVLYGICKYRQIKTRMFERIDLPGLLYVVDDFLASVKGLEKTYQECRDSGATPSGRLRRYAEELRDLSFSPIPPNFKKKLQSRGLTKSWDGGGIVSLLTGYCFELKRIGWVLLRGGGLQGPPNYLKIARKPPHQRMGLLRWGLHRLRSVQRKHRLARVYNESMKLPSKYEPFVLFALHYQPERATVPLAGHLGDQSIVVEMVARSLPSGWTLYIKEHPWQLQPYSKGELSRNIEFYARLKEFKNVAFLPLDADVSALLDSTKAVVTGTGSLGWHGAIRGVPAMVFGAAWYRPLNGVYSISSEQDVRVALQEIAEQPRVKWGDVMALLAAAEMVCRPGTLEPDLEAVEGLSIDNAVEGMYEALVESVDDLKRARRKTPLIPGITAAT